MFLNITPTVTNWANEGKQFSLVFDENPLADFVELPDDGRAQDELWYSNMLCGVLRGALEMVWLWRSCSECGHARLTRSYRCRFRSRLISLATYCAGTTTQRCEFRWCATSKMRCHQTMNEF